MAESLIKQDSYWYVNGEGDDAKMSAMCVICAKKQKKGWLWESRLGYGDYDLFCSVCGNAIHIRGEEKIEACNKSQ